MQKTGLIRFFSSLLGGWM